MTAAAQGVGEIDPATITGCEGFYRVGKDTAGRWWLLDPAGRPVVYRGCCAVCDGIPGKRYTEVYRERYGDDHARFVADSTAVLRDLGFNAYGMWSYLRTPDAGYDRTGMGTVEYVHAREARRESTVSGAGCKCVDPFDPAWQAAFDACIAERAARHRDNPHLVGYFVENEPFWGQIWHKVDQGAEGRSRDQEQGRTWVGAKNRPHRWGEDPIDGKAHGSLLQIFLCLPPDRPGHDAAWRWVLDRHGGSLERLATDWGVSFADPGDFRARTEAGMILNSVAYGADHEAFTRHWMRTFYRVTGEAIRRHDPHHLRLGVRHCADWSVHGRAVLGGYDDPEIRRHVDVCGINTYADWPAEAIAQYAAHFDLPILIGEYSWGGWIWPGQTYPPEWADDHEGWLRREGVRRTAALLAHPQVIGYTWFKWYCDNTDPAVPAYAVVTEEHEVNRFNAPLFRRLHAGAEAVHAGMVSPEAVAEAG